MMTLFVTLQSRTKFLQEIILSFEMAKKPEHLQTFKVSLEERTKPFKQVRNILKPTRCFF